LVEGNKPLDGSAMAEIKDILMKTDPFKLAKHMTIVDCEFCQINSRGLENIFLSKGSRLRKQLIERYQSVAFWVVICILRGGNDYEERADILNIFIQIANELVHSLGNVYGFSAIMHGLLSPQLSNMSELWSLLRTRHTNNAVTMEKKLRPLLILYDEGIKQPLLSHTCIPHILPILRYFENPTAGITHRSRRKNNPDVFDKEQICASEGDMLGSIEKSQVETDESWWENIPDDSFDSLMAHLSYMRKLISSLDVLKTNTRQKFQDFEKKGKIYEIFSTIFHMRLLWGHKGIDSPLKERYEKIDRLITLIIRKLPS